MLFVASIDYSHTHHNDEGADWVVKATLPKGWIVAGILAAPQHGQEQVGITTSPPLP